MKIRLTIILFVSFLLSGLTIVKAQTIGTPPTASALKAAEDMLIASGMDTQFDKNISGMVAQYSTQIPEDKRAQFTEVMTKFLTRYISWEMIKHDIFVMYAREFTEPELKQLTAFYRSPVGMKLKEKQPLLLQTGAAIGQQAVAAHEDELKKMMEDVMK